MIDRNDSLPMTRQCQLLSLNRSTVYYQPKGMSDEDMRLMRRIDEMHLKRPSMAVGGSWTGFGKKAKRSTVSGCSG